MRSFLCINLYSYIVFNIENTFKIFVVYHGIRAFVLWRWPWHPCVMTMTSLHLDDNVPARSRCLLQHLCPTNLDDSARTMMAMLDDVVFFDIVDDGPTWRYLCQLRHLCRLRFRTPSSPTTLLPSSIIVTYDFVCSQHWRLHFYSTATSSSNIDAFVPAWLRLRPPITSTVSIINDALVAYDFELHHLALPQRLTSTLQLCHLADSQLTVHTLTSISSSTLWNMDAWWIWCLLCLKSRTIN